MSIARGLDAWYRADGNTNDASGNGVNATWNIGTAKYADGKYGQAFDFDNTNAMTTGSETIGDGLFAGSDRRWTVSFWAKIPAGDSRGSIIARDSGTSPSWNFVLFYQSEVAGRNPCIVVRGTVTNTNAGTEDGNWHHHTVTWDGTTCRYYVDGVFFMNIGVGSASENTGVNILIGKRHGSAALLTGQIDNTLIENYARTPSQIKTLYALGSPL